MQYQELKAKRKQQLDDFTGIFYAFSNQQLREGMQKLDLDADNPEHLKKVSRIGNGGFLLKSKGPEFKELIEGFDRDMAAMKANPKHLEEALVDELVNHEFSYTNDPTDALECLDLSEDDLPPGMMERAKNRCYDLCPL